VSRSQVVYQLQDPDGSYWGELPLMEFDTTYCMPGQPFRIFEGGEWWQASGIVEFGYTTVWRYVREDDSERCE
jgi:hypothetical protein